jgi:hypothetical protein
MLPPDPPLIIVLGVPTVRPSTTGRAPPGSSRSPAARHTRVRQVDGGRETWLAVLRALYSGGGMQGGTVPGGWFGTGAYWGLGARAEG